jgi:hypothetical protein
MGGAVTPNRRKRQTTDQRGMVPADQWEKTSVHQASSYRCARCGKHFDSPDAVYDHLDTEHPKRKGGRSGGSRTG